MIQLQSIWELINQVKTWNSFNAFFSPLCVELKPHKHNNRFAKNVLYVNCYCSDENAIWIEWWLKHRKKQKPRFAFWLLFQFSFYPLKYTGINTSFLMNLKKQTLVGKQTLILLMYVDCIKYCSLRLKTNLKIIVSDSQFNILILSHDTIFIWVPEN